MPTSLPVRGARSSSSSCFPLRAHIDHQISDALLKNRTSLFAYAVGPPLFEHDFSSWSDAYVPIARSDEADRQLGALLSAARKVLRQHGRITLNDD
jgi:hypothetical protein